MDTQPPGEAVAAGTALLPPGIPSRWIDALVPVAGLAALTELVASLAAGEYHNVAWVLAGVALLGLAVAVRRKRPDNPISGWLALMAGATVVAQSLDTALAVLGQRTASSWGLLGVMVPGQLLSLVSVVASLHLFGLFPNAKTDRRWQRRALSASWWLVAVPALLPFVTPTLALPRYHSRPPIESPLYVLPVDLPPSSGITTIEIINLSVMVAAVMLIARYRRMSPPDRKQTRWLLVPIVFASISVAAYAIFDWPNWLFSLLFIGASLSLTLAIAGGLLAPARLDVDTVLRRSVLYGSIWLLISAGYVGIASVLGLAAGQRLSTTWAVAATGLAAIAFQPFRARLESAADRWIFGVRADPGKVIARLGAALTETYDLATLVPRIESTLRDGLGLEWVRVRLVPMDLDATVSPALSIPIIDDGDRLGVIECGPRSGGPLTDEDRQVVETFARHAGLAIRNLRLTVELSHHVAELERSRFRLLQAQERERRRLERNLHDGAQQELVALIAHAGRLRRRTAVGPDDLHEELDELQHGLERVLAEIRDLARGIHPNLLRDRGLLAAVEDIAVRTPVHVHVRADPSLRGMRLPETIEGAAYYVVAESLTNALKHANAESILVTLSRRNGSVVVSVEDDGVGMPSGPPAGTGLSGLSDRVAALGGAFEVSGNGGGTTVTAEFEMPRT